MPEELQDLLLCPSETVQENCTTFNVKSSRLAEWGVGIGVVVPQQECQEWILLLCQCAKYLGTDQSGFFALFWLELWKELFYPLPRILLIFIYFWSFFVMEMLKKYPQNTCFEEFWEPWFITQVPRPLAYATFTPNKALPPIFFKRKSQMSSSSMLLACWLTCLISASNLFSVAFIFFTIWLIDYFCKKGLLSAYDFIYYSDIIRS